MNRSDPSKAAATGEPGSTEGIPAPVDVAARATLAFPVVVIGASMGGVQVLQRLAAALPADLAAPILVVLHIGAQRSYLPELLSAKGPLPASHAVDGETIVPGRIYVAPSGRHLLVEAPGRLRLSRGPKEHHSRPAIDPLFRSAALAFGPNAVGVVLTGMLDDGTPGLQAIKECGGIAVVQDPRDAEAPSMPRSAMRYVTVDHCVPLAELPELLVDLVRTAHAAPAPARPMRASHEHALFLWKGAAVEHLKAIGAPSTYVCPECHGSLWELAQAQPRRFRCHTGHAFTLRTLQHAQAMATDEALWNAVRALQEKKLIMEDVAIQCRADGDEARADELAASAGEIQRLAAELRDLIWIEPEPPIE